MKTTLILLPTYLALVISQTAVAEDGLYYEASGGARQKADVKIRKASVYSLNNANTSFYVSLETSDITVDAQSLAYCVGGRTYHPNGWGSSGGHTTDISFIVNNESEARAIAKSLEVECGLRSPPGYKYLAQFVPAKAEFQKGEPVMVKLELRNLDDRPFAFQRGGQQRGSRDNQFGFRAMFNYDKPVLDTGNPVNFGGLWWLAQVEPGKTFEAEVDLKKWFAFDQAGTYSIHGFYQMNFYPAGNGKDAARPGNILWVDYANDDFVVVIK